MKLALALTLTNAPLELITAITMQLALTTKVLSTASAIRDFREMDILAKVSAEISAHLFTSATNLTNQLY